MAWVDIELELEVGERNCRFGQGCVIVTIRFLGRYEISIPANLGSLGAHARGFTMVRYKQEGYLINKQCGVAATELAILYDERIGGDIKQAGIADLLGLYRLAECNNLLLWLEEADPFQLDVDEGLLQASQADDICHKTLEGFRAELEKILLYRIYIRSLRDDQVFEQYASLRREEIKASREIRRARGLENDAGQFFNEPEADIDREAWLSKASWSIDEFVAFSMGKSPEIVSAEKLAPFWRPHSSPFREEYQRRLDQVNRSVAIGALKPHEVPRKYLDWAQKAGMPLVDFNGSDSYEAIKADTLHGGTLHSLYKIVLMLMFELNSTSDVSDPVRFVDDVVARLIENKLSSNIYLHERTMMLHIENATKWAIKEGLLSVKDPPVAFRKNPTK